MVCYKVLDSQADNQDDEFLMHALRQADLASHLRLKAALALARSMSRRSQDVSRSEAMDFEQELERGKGILLEHPATSLQVANNKRITKKTTVC